MGATPNYTWPYQGLGDPPNGPTLGADGFTAADGTVHGIDVRLTAAEGIVTTLNAAPKFFVARHTCVGAESSVTLGSIPVGLRSLKIDWSARGDAASTQAQSMTLQIGADTGSVYTYSYKQMRNITDGGSVQHLTTSAVCGIYTAAAATSAWFGSGHIDFSAWDITATTLGFEWISQAMGTTTTDHFLDSGAGNYSGANSRTSIKFLPQSGNFIAGSDFSLLGVYA